MAWMPEASSHNDDKILRSCKCVYGFALFMEKLILSSHNDEKTGGPCEMSGERQVPCVNPQLNGIVPRVHPHHALRSKTILKQRRDYLYLQFPIQLSMPLA